jgi:two-component system response regulator
MTEPSVEILLVQRDQQQIQLTLDIVQSHHLANRIHVVRDGAEALEFLFRSGPYADRQPVDPRLVLFHLRPAESADIEVLTRIRRDPRTAAIPVTVLACSSDDRLAAMSELRDYGLPVPVVVIARPAPAETVRALASIGGACAEDDDHQQDLVSVVGGADDAAQPSEAKRPAAGAAASFAALCLERDLEALIRLTRGAAHEFNNLFSVIVGYTELLLREMDGNDPRRAGAEEILKSIRRASKLTREMLTFSPSGTRPSTPEPPLRPAFHLLKRSSRADTG